MAFDHANKVALHFLFTSITKPLRNRGHEFLGGVAQATTVENGFASSLVARGHVRPDQSACPYRKIQCIHLRGQTQCFVELFAVEFICRGCVAHPRIKTAPKHHAANMSRGERDEFSTQLSCCSNNKRCHDAPLVRIRSTPSPEYFQCWWITKKGGS